MQCCHSKVKSDSESGALQSVTHYNAGSALWYWMTLHLNPTQPIYLPTTRTVAASSWTGHNHYNPSRQLWFYCQSIPLDSERHWVQELRLTCVHYEIKIFMFAFCLQELVYVCTRQPDIIVRSVRKDSMVQQQTVHPRTVHHVPATDRVLVSNRYCATKLSLGRLLGNQWIVLFME